MKIVNKLLLLILFFSSLSAKDEKKRIGFIVNPISHEIQGIDVKKMIDRYLDHCQFTYELVYTEYPNHAAELAQTFLDRNYDIIAAIGGDGTVNEVGSALIHSQACLAIIPVGSGNGLARHLAIPIGLKQGIQTLNNAKTVSIDSATLNERVFLCSAGVGFDAHIAEAFSKFGKRGFLSYCQVALQEYSRYRPQIYSLVVDGKPMTGKAFILSFANSSQYGNNFIIAPTAKVDDGYLDLVIIKEIPPLSIFKFLYLFRLGSLEGSKYFESYKFKELIIKAPNIKAHLDGEVIEAAHCLQIRAVAHSLKIMVPNTY